MNKYLINIPFILFLLLLALIPLDIHHVIWRLSVVDILVISIFFTSIPLIVKQQPIYYSNITAITLFILISFVILRVPPLLVYDEVLNQPRFILQGSMIAVLFFSISLIKLSRKKIILAIKIIMISVLVVNLINILQAFELITLPDKFMRIRNSSRSLLGYRTPRGTTAFFRLYGSYGLWSNIALCFAIVSTVKPIIFRRKLSAIFSIIILFGSTWALQSRTVWIGVAVMLMSTVIVYSYTKDVFKKAVFVISSIVLLSAPIAINHIININRHTVDKRINQYEMTIQIFLNHPILPVPNGTILEALGSGLHSLYFQFLIFNGIIGFLLLIVLIAIHIRALIVKSLYSEDVIAIGFLGAFVGNLALSMTHPSSSSYILWIQLALISMYIQKNKSDPRH